MAADRHTRASALREAERLTGELERRDGGWVFTHYDFSKNARRESSPCVNASARKLRSATVAVTAHCLLCGDTKDAIAAQKIALDAGGSPENRLYAILRALPVPARVSESAA